MGIHTASPQNSFALQQERGSWDPVKVIEITNSAKGEKEGFTCVGNTMPGIRCRNRIKQSTQLTVYQRLRDLSPDSPNIASELKELARLSLCGKDHSSQEKKVFEKWYQKILSSHTRFKEQESLVVTKAKARREQEGEKVQEKGGGQESKTRKGETKGDTMGESRKGGTGKSETRKEGRGMQKEEAKQDRSEREMKSKKVPEARERAESMAKQGREEQEPQKRKRATLGGKARKPYDTAVTAEVRLSQDQQPGHSPSAREALMVRGANVKASEAGQVNDAIKR